MTTGGKRPPLREQLSLFEGTIAREGTTTGAGNVAGNTIIDAGLIGVGVDSFLSMLLILYPGDFNNVDSADITVFNNANGEITFDHPYKNVAAAVPAGIRYKIVTFRFVPAEVAALVAIVNALAADITGAIGIFHEQVDAAIDENVAAAEIFVVTLNDADTRYILRDLRIKSEDPTAANTITVRLYTLINDGEVNVDSFIITNANFGTHFSLMDMFGVPYVAGDSIRVSVQGSAAGPYDVIGQYSHGKTNV